MTPLDAAIAWIQKGFSPVPIPHRSKRPILKEWEQLEIATDAAPQYFNGNQQNIGVHPGGQVWLPAPELGTIQEQASC